MMDRNAMIRVIWTISRELGMDSEDVHSVLCRETGKESMRECTDTQLKRMMRAMQLMSGVREGRSERATYKQLKYISSLEYQLGWKDNPERMRGFLKKNNYPMNVKWLDVKQASNLIEGLKKLLEREAEKKAVQ